MTTLLSTLQAGSLTLTLNRPGRANAFNFEMTSALLDALAEAERDPQVRCVVVTGAGKVFSSGQDIEEMKKVAGGISYRGHLDKTYNPLILQIRRMGKPVIAAVNGPCAGAAFGIALACDLRIAHSRAYFVVGFGPFAPPAEIHRAGAGAGIFLQQQTHHGMGGAPVGHGQPRGRIQLSAAGPAMGGGAGSGSA
jgi:1,4-dihydroxy-2-naphthoyl-CoA synthase